MRKQNRQFIILAVVLIALIGGYIGLTKYNSRQQEQEPDPLEGEVLIDISRDDILRFSYVYNGETYAFEKTRISVNSQGDNNTDESIADSGSVAEEPQMESRWVYTEDTSLNLIQSRVNTMAGKLTSIVAQNIINDVTDMSQYGLDAPSTVLHWETEQRSYTYNVGDYNSISGVYYICEPDSHTVYTVSASLGKGFDYNLEDLIETENDEPQGSF